MLFDLADIFGAHKFRNLLPVLPKLTNSVDKFLMLFIRQLIAWVLKDWKNVSAEHVRAHTNDFLQIFRSPGDLITFSSAYCLWNLLPVRFILSHSFYKSLVLLICPIITKFVQFGSRLSCQFVFSRLFQISLLLALIRSRLKLWRNFFVEFALWFRSFTLTFNSFYRQQFAFFERWALDKVCGIIFDDEFEVIRV